MKAKTHIRFTRPTISRVDLKRKSLGLVPRGNSLFNTLTSSVSAAQEPWLLHEFEDDFYDEELRLVVVGYIRPEVTCRNASLPCLPMFTSFLLLCLFGCLVAHDSTEREYNVFGHFKASRPHLSITVALDCSGLRVF